MKLILLLAALVAVLYAKSFQMNARSVGSLRARLIASGKYRQYLNQQRMRRIQILRKGSQPFLDYTDDFYVGMVNVGTPGQNVTLVLDTGSSNLWVIDDACQSEACNGFPQSGYPKHKFNTNASETFTKEERSFSLFYGSGSCNGYLATDAVSFAGLTIPKQEFGVATEIADVFGYQPVDGILGLGWPDLAVDQVVPPMQNILSELDKPIFTVWLDRKVKPSEGGTGGLITYGDFDLKNCAPDVTYVQLSSLTYWQFPIQGFSIGNFSQTNIEQVISDTGTSWIGAPDSVVNAVAQEIGAKFDWNNQLYTVPCSSMETNPDLVFTINGVQYNIPSVEYILDLELG
ncbi:eukaryotic aspartyl protease, partial [Ancylostoma caninum]